MAANATAFSRGDRGFVAINRDGTSLTQTVATGLAPGTYCDRISGGRAGSACAGSRLVIASDGSTSLTLATRTAIAVDVPTRL